MTHKSKRRPKPKTSNKSHSAMTRPKVAVERVLRMPRLDLKPGLQVRYQVGPSLTLAGHSPPVLTVELWHMPIEQTPWTQSYVLLGYLQHRDIYCLKPENPIADHLTHFLHFSKR